MRPFEIAIVVLDALSLLSRFYRPMARGLSLVFAGLAVAAMFVHGVVEGPRWQMIPLYVLTVLLFVLALRPLFVRTRAQPSLAWTIVGLAALALACLPPFLAPVPSFAKPTGSYRVGTTSFYWVDDSRTEQYAPQPGGPRRLMVQVWYPAEPRPTDKRAPWLEGVSLGGAALARQNDLPPQLAGYLALARTNSYVDAPLVAGSERFPVLVFSHGWTGFRTQNTYQMEMLASHGYIVIAPDHTYGAGMTVFPDGSVALNNPKALPGDDLTGAEYDRVARQLGLTWLDDLRFVLDQAGRLDAGQIQSPFAGRLNLDEVGVFGHSTGGGAAVEMCWSDARCKAGLAEDAWLVPYSRAMTAEGLKTPFFFLQSQFWGSDKNKALVKALYANTPADLFHVTIAGTVHYDFTDVPAFSPLTGLLGFKGSVPARRMESIVNAYTLAFFDKYLKGVDSSLLKGMSSQYPEVSW